MIFTGCSIATRYFFIGRYKTISKEQYQINEEIRDREVRLLGTDGEQIGIVSSEEALRLADEAELDLVKISPTANPPVCKIMNYSKFKYEQGKRAKELKKNQKTVELKEIWLSMTIDIGDLKVKASQASKFIAQGNKVKVSIKMRGRQNAHSDLGVEVMNKFFAMLEEVAVMEKKPLFEGKNILMILAPKA